ncbi:hypothetical protein [Streptomyces sp. NPDC000880]
MLITSPTRRAAFRHRARRTVIAAAVLAALLGTAGCGAEEITRARVEAAVGPTYKNLYLLQHQMQHGTNEAPPPVPSTANCTKGGRANTEGGPGTDWACKVRWLAPTGAVVALTYEVAVLPNGCYTAQGPSGLVGQQRIRGMDWTDHTNPIYEFDGCFDTNS